MGNDGRMGGCYLCFGVVLMGIATMFYCISYTTPNWITGQVYNRTMRLGLWQTCLDEICVGIHEDDNALRRILGTWVEICEVIASLAVALWCIAILLTGGYLITSKCTLLKVTAFTLFISSLLYATTMLIYTMEASEKGLVNFNDPVSPLNVSSSLYTGIFGVLCGICAGALYLVDYYKNVYYRAGYERIN